MVWRMPPDAGDLIRLWPSGVYLSQRLHGAARRTFFAGLRAGTFQNVLTRDCGGAPFLNIPAASGGPASNVSKVHTL